MDRLEKLIHPTAHLLIRFIGDLEADQRTHKHTSGLRRRHCATTLCRFAEENLDPGVLWQFRMNSFLTHVNLIAHWANLGCLEEEAVRNHILQCLVSHPKRDDYQAIALIVLFNLAGATFETYVEPSVVDSCFEFINVHYVEYGYCSVQLIADLAEVSARCPVKKGSSGSDKPSGDHRVTGRWLGRPPSSTRIHDRGRPERPRRNSCHHISRTSGRGS